jgi:hypothetical protein
MNAMAWLFIVSLGQVSSDNEAELKEVLYPFYGQEAAEYQFFLDPQHQKRLELQKQPVLTWTNAENYMGAVFVWTYAGKPELIGCIGSHQFQPDKANVFHEFHSLSLQPLHTVKQGGGKLAWAPSRPGVEWTLLEDAQRPSDSQPLRLTQMRNIAREFSGAMRDNQDVTELRMLTQPIVRYKSPEQGVEDGAIFALVWKGTDPEILLILENRKDKSENRWHFALARFNYREMWVKRNDREIWRVGTERPRQIYITDIVGNRTISEIRTMPRSRHAPP